jgi:PAB-dependent poly(A)-specific ribonuclease subunit 2
MSFTTKGTNEVLVAGRQATMFRVNVEKGVVTETVCTSDFPLLLREA